MAHTFANLLTHVIFSTKDRELQGKAVAANSMPDHVRMLLWLPPGVAVAEAMRVVKTNSSRWVHQTRSRLRGFAWQTGCGAFSVSQPNAASVAKYIREQERRHLRVSFQEEFIGFLRKNDVRLRRAVHLGMNSFAPPGLCGLG